MRITKDADYALRICLCLARHDTTMTAAAIAEEIGITRPYVLRILRSLNLAQITSGQKGNGGGYGLLIDPEALSVGAVIEIMDGEIALSDCLGCGSPCSQYGDRTYACPFHAYFFELSSDLRAELHRTMIGSFLNNTAHSMLF